MSFQIDKSKLYQKLFESFKKSHTSTKVQNVQKLVNEVWRNYKLQAKSDKELDIIVSKRIEEELQAATKNKSNLLHFFSKVSDEIILGTYEYTRNIRNRQKVSLC